MKLISSKKKSDVENLVDIYGLKPEPYETKENLITVAGVLLPLATFCATVTTFDPAIVAGVTAYSLLPSLALMLYGDSKAYNKHNAKLRKADDYYRDESIANISEVLADNIKFNAKDFNHDLNDFPQDELFKKASKLNALKIRRDARDITDYQYKESCKELEK